MLLTIAQYPLLVNSTAHYKDCSIKISEDLVAFKTVDYTKTSMLWSYAPRQDCINNHGGAGCKTDLEQSLPT